ncbi:MAG: hypothetical protein JGK24_16500 [Microcoleus sp. PH2017_29_MFU_D_A]|uniref:hypothetical protein n=1 Tax=unclassified Microcoleus TaxID=2642155 RepID=UPI001DB7FF8E|nr:MULTISPECIES: hypothetical protein [unclassified Microcoleus]MCC3421141.1 hypothetical protein [Microcoleus sp. PH2017_07_MST_O_A]MCC3432696.1 hypothetical protein [Microcoleus sp. PH2017_04_SCI_O_A]MCC3443504.1 hypothetical protein [Microcoleus sp. PH2017_03_ELD_O_A]MCC3468874.1 hypothetical protein [Microcoleus sp. PH2017_06_SFM_O_A]MCC3506382.1 hypothetical protein [Microcoleus sp. PH2017_19_SFW_U_A]MCC3509487.1 hypothetical protein [Microcoleus sp. PH2017_17_BER_D_A]TAE08905.1 MAG: hy
MAYVNRPVDNVVTEQTLVKPVMEYHDLVRWGPIFSGLVIAIGTQLVLSALGAAIGLSNIANSGAPRSIAGNVGTGVGIWSIISLLISLGVGGWVTARACGPMNRSTALLNGAILWATTLTIGSWLLANGVAGTFGVVAANAGAAINQAQQGGVNLPNQAPSVSAQDARNIAENAAKAGWSFLFGSLLGLVASMAGASAGARTPRNHL